MANSTDDPKQSSLALNDSQKALEVDRKLWLNERLAAAELMKTSPPLDDLGRKMTINLWLKTLNEIGEERFDAALQQTLETSSFRPDISEIRKNAGILANPIEEEADREFTRIIKLQRHHGWKLTNRGNPPIEPPGGLGEPTMGTIAAMGRGDIRAGLQAIWEHPALDKVRPADELDSLESFRMTAGEKIERKWIGLYTQQKIKLAKGGGI
jgi:hypothetical protein